MRNSRRRNRKKSFGDGLLLTTMTLTLVATLLTLVGLHELIIFFYNNLGLL